MCNCDKRFVYFEQNVDVTYNVIHIMLDMQLFAASMSSTWSIFSLKTTSIFFWKWKMAALIHGPADILHRSLWQFREKKTFGY